MTRKKIFYRLAVVAALILAFSLQTPAQDLAPKFDEYLSEITKQGRFTGAALIARDGKVIFSKGYGLANAEFDIPNTPQTKFRLGSVTKQFTAVSILLLQERGKLNVQDSICKYFDACPEAWKEVTVHHLLTHTGGLPNFTNFPDYTKTMMIPTSMESLIARFKDKPLDFKPGEKWNYSNSGYVTLGYIVEKVAGESYESFVRKNIFDPLKMANTGYDHHETILKNRATGYSLDKGRKVNSLPIDMTIPHGAGALYSTVEDLFLWNEALFSDKLLSAKSREAMMTPVKNGYGYGIGMNEQLKRKTVSHSGGINGFSTILVRFPEEKITIVVLRNADYGSPNPGKVALDLAAIIFGEKYEIPRAQTEIKVESKVLDAYVGEYELTPAFKLTITNENGQLMMHPTGQPKFELYAESETKFFLKVIEAGVTFVKNDKGEVTHLILHQGGDKQAKKIK
ncbi:MAG TPA: serine hydrolase [Blastocatellia bacterium]|nr:serine hydrolase [Blastocatellia bacterium]HMV83123.1 serine hydrolase [Blastocatellia bacterium]HMX26496.1 serine hydrolase [Blastocatellia bacterium]HMY71151.1 serine hydrolase [Blastocatellia bacterium]HMZ20413.1 serine hydrolase [Blastocatellia bacterium]